MVVGMEIVGVVERVEHISAVRSNPTADADLIQSGLVAIREVQAWCDAQHAGLVARLRDVDAFPEQRIAKPTPPRSRWDRPRSRRSGPRRWRRPRTWLMRWMTGRSPPIMSTPSPEHPSSSTVPSRPS
jgi:hypothetical protein